MSRDQFTRAIILLVLSTSTPAFSQTAVNPTAVCPVPLDVPDRPVVDGQLQPGETSLDADSSESIAGGITRLQGNVEVTRDSQQAKADLAEYDQANRTLDLEGDVNYWNDDIYVHGEAAHVDLNDKTANLGDAEYRVLSNRGRGKAEELHVVSEKVTSARGVDYSTCDPDGDRASLATNTWKLSAGEITLNHESGWGVGRNVVLRIKDIPVFYTPYMTFPLNNARKSGFLAPEFGNTRRNGAELQLPYYWNIAPNMDATFTPRIISDSGLMLMGEFRYLTASSRGNINAEFLPSDNNYFDKDRSYLSIDHEQRFAYNGKLHVVFNNLSDNRYLEDFGPSLDVTSISAVDRYAELSFAGDNWDAFARVQDFQTTNRNNPYALKPYKRLPQIGFDYSSPLQNHTFNYRLGSELVYFQRTSQDFSCPADTCILPVALPFAPGNFIPPLVPVSDVEGMRFDINPSISYPVHTVSSFIEPKIGIHYTAYDLSGTGISNDSPDRLLPYASIDAGLFLDRQVNLFNESVTQTLEPRLYYLYIPKDNQADIPVFDTGLYDDSFDSLFYENRYSGIDRINDANRLTLAVTSRLIDGSGRDLGHLSIGQIYNLHRQQVTLPGQVIADRDLSPLVFELGTNLSENLSLRAGWQWEPNANRMQKVDLRLRYRPESGKVLNFAYRKRRAFAGVIRTDAIDIEQTDVSVHWPVTGEWNVVGRWIYALNENKSLDIFGGIEYDSCCWDLRVVGRRFVSNVEGGVQTGIFLQFELKGLAGLGQKTVDFLYQNIPGYTDEF